jgi:hypothetical protein
MSRHLQVVREEPQGSAYVVARTHHARPGAPFVLAHCADRAVASVFALAGQEVHSRSEMERDPRLAEALAAWESDDQGLFETERAARAATRGSERHETMRALGRHPSLLGKQQLP